MKELVKIFEINDGLVRTITNSDFYTLKKKSPGSEKNIAAFLDDRWTLL